MFHNQPRYDYALVKVHEEEYVIAQILYIFQITINGTQCNMALILPFDVPRMLQNRKRDTDLRLERVYPRPRASSVFVNTNTIVRGVLLAEDRASPAGEHHVINFIDQDMWMRMKTLRLITHAPI